MRPSIPKRRAKKRSDPDMARFVDTNILVRYLTDDPPEMAERAAELLERAGTITISPVILAETAYTLVSFYQRPREIVVDSLVELLQRENIVCHGLDKGMAILGLLKCRPSGRVSFADALLWATARSESGSVVYSFDRRFPTDGLEVNQ